LHCLPCGKQWHTTVKSRERKLPVHSARLVIDSTGSLRWRLGVCRCVPLLRKKQRQNRWVALLAFGQAVAHDGLEPGA